jgi:hypothetical protein
MGILRGGGSARLVPPPPCTPSGSITMDSILTLAAAAPIPAGTIIDGAVAELAREPDGTITAQIRIPGPAA